jgi:hypothetical protein
MRSRGEILRAHYLGILRKAATWAGLGSILATMFVAAPASATLGTQMGARSVTPTTSKAAATGVSYAFTFQPGTTSTIGSLKFEICDSPLESVGCAASASGGVNSNGADASAATFTSLTGTGCTGGTWAVGAGTGPGTSGTSRKLTNSGSAVSPTTAQTCVLTFGAIVNPAGNNQHYYLRLTTYSDTAYTTEVDFGGFALMTAQDLTITAAVQESLTFCIGDTSSSGCASPGTGAISLATGSGCPILSTSNVCTGVAYMAASTNANAGYSITFKGTTFTGPSDTITETGSGGATSSPGSKQFGLAGTAISGGGSGAWNATYNFGTNGSKYTFQNATTTNIASAGAATAENIYTITYAANVSNTTKPGQYTSTFNYVATGLF